MSIIQAVTPLRMIFWGGLLCILDFSISSTTSVNGGAVSGFRFDILNDFVGMLLITFAVRKLSAFDVSPQYRNFMNFVFILAVLNTISAFMGHFIFETPPVLGFVSNLVGLASLAATVMFCTSMNQLALQFSLERSAASWLTTRILVICVWGIPLGLLHAAGLIAQATGQSFHYNFGLIALPIILAMVVPLVHLFISTSRMQHDAEHSL